MLDYDLVVYIEYMLSLLRRDTSISAFSVVCVTVSSAIYKFEWDQDNEHYYFDDDFDPETDDCVNTMSFHDVRSLFGG